VQLRGCNRDMAPPRLLGSIRTTTALVALGGLLLAAAPSHAQVGALYRCASNEYTNMISADEAAARGCTKIAKAEWVASGSDANGRRYEYNDRRTVFRGDGIVETWLQVVPSTPETVAGDDAAVVKTVSRQVIRCDRRTIASGATYTFDPRDNSVVRDSREQSPFFPPPGAVAEKLMRNLCANAATR
jgi:surface-adhesin protein E